ncbi:oxaloacetate decarboxylase subunit gamma [Parasalinivibrio latis]|uniref:oxaloacetate decarboxylase subunit gamma n=1 Tax=Parasalinivibrio latis TaxID=2952610 RepID=UPI0006D147BC
MELGAVLEEALALMLIGMSVVYAFLGLLVITVKLISRLVPEEQPPQAATAVQPATNHNNSAAPDVIAAISAAVHQYRNRNK